MSIIIEDRDLKKFYNLSDDDIKNKTVIELQKLTDNMQKQKAYDQAKKNENDKEYARLIHKYFTPYAMLRKYWTDEEIILACSKHMNVRDIVSEYETELQNCPYSDGEFIESRMSYVKQYYHGHELRELKRTRVNAFRIKNEYQGLRHGAVILDLLYSRYPILSRYKFKAYSYDYNYNLPYEMYPENNIFTPFEALMQKDIDAIIKRNLNYANNYNNGIFTPSETQKRLNSDEAKDFFETIKNL